MNALPDLPASALRAEAERIRASGALGRSDAMLRLFDFLLARSISGDPPKEIEVAMEVFGKEADYDPLPDASVRVYISRLRKKLDESYLSQPPGQPRLLIPRGEYRLVLVASDGQALSEEALEEPGGIAGRPLRERSGRLWAIAAAVLLLISAIGWLIVVKSVSRDPARAAADVLPWSGLDPRSPTLLVVGDYFIFGEAVHGAEASRLVREFSVNSREDLDRLLMERPELIGRYVDIGLHYLPTSAAAALHKLAEVVRVAGTSEGEAPRLVTASALTPGLMKGANLVYVGYISGLGILQSPALQSSNFAVGDSFDELIDRGTGRRYRSDWSRALEGQTPNRDYAYVASAPGLSPGTRMLIIAGTRDAGLIQAADIASDAEELRRLADKVGAEPYFEGLYEVRTHGDTNFASRLVAAYPLRVAKPTPSRVTGNRG